MTLLNHPVFEIHPGIRLKGQLSMAKDVLITGKFEGDLKTLGRLTVAAGGVMTGSIEAGALVLEAGHQVEARIHVGALSRPKVEAPVRTRKPAGKKWPASLQKLKELALGRK
ncbi:MAG: polymer-forming cytoskeletal protein [Methylacidiphilales bacterium]|nr:polymer-forming cytoskeletal protein [Candidatus Methylacidiphilales bacterium]